MGLIFNRKPEPPAESAVPVFGPTAVIVTRGDVDLKPVLDAIPKEWPRVIWDNSKRSEDLKVYGHFAALAEVQTEYVVMQDDDAICPLAELVAHWNEAEHAGKILLNEADGETPWISWGGIFHRDLPLEPMQRWIAEYGFNDDLLCWCDLIFATLVPWVNVDLGRQSLPHAYGRDRMWANPNHFTEQARVREMARKLLPEAER